MASEADVLMTDLFEYIEARKARDEGMTRADENSDELWKRDMAICLREVCAMKSLFTSDDVFNLAREKGLSSDTHDRRAFGPIMMRAAKDGLVVKENCAARPSSRKSLHGSPRAVWRSLIEARK
jgi:hypothetical protein